MIFCLGTLPYIWGLTSRMIDRNEGENNALKHIKSKNMPCWDLCCWLYLHSLLFGPLQDLKIRFIYSCCLWECIESYEKMKIHLYDLVGIGILFNCDDSSRRYYVCGCCFCCETHLCSSCSKTRAHTTIVVVDIVFIIPFALYHASSIGTFLGPFPTPIMPNWVQEKHLNLFPGPRKVGNISTNIWTIIIFMLHCYCFPIVLAGFEDGVFDCQ